MASSLPNLLHEAIQPTQEDAEHEPVYPQQTDPPLRRSTRIKKLSRSMLERLASHGTTLDPAATALYACGNNNVILSIFAATQSPGDDTSQSSTKLTSDDIDTFLTAGSTL
ncbi:hypothetical protein N7519_008266 [Penicillium mononematosum]|uniref:uncharacterized protein n=1 Tax=Penicillium mononematosum TaxID=268346 RepID=UPI00254984E5|nr:uncharacterized protein N7519_008266 [Penicillium mononematosum]KAJ6177805.1 hypothetical protein N7519_008266 [Penicillium mononematosum]